MLYPGAIVSTVGGCLGWSMGMRFEGDWEKEDRAKEIGALVLTGTRSTSA